MTKGFDYVKVGALEEAIGSLGKHGEKGQIQAGGTDVWAKLKQKKIALDILVDIIRCSGSGR